VSEKTTPLKKKFHEKNGSVKKVMTIFLKNFFKKNQNFQKKIFLKVVISFLNMARKKSFFFEIFFGPDFDPNSENVAKEWKSQISNYRPGTFSSLIFMTKITV